MSQLLLRQLPRKEIAMLKTIRGQGRVLTRIKEFGDGDVEHVQLPLTLHAFGDANEATISDDDVLTCLHSLEDRGLVTCSMRVHATSTTEYICEWTLREDERAAIRRTPSAVVTRNVYSCGDVQLDCTEFVAHVNQQRVLLTMVQADLLSQLMRDPGRTLTRSELAHGPAGAGDASEACRSVDVQVARLRRKLGAATRFAIETVRGVGYRCIDRSSP